MGLTKRVWMVGVVAVMLIQYYCCCSANGYCWEEERIGLLQLRHDFFNDPFSLTDWVQSGEKSRDCCLWERVVCDSTTGRVIELDLTATTSWDSGGGWYYLNASLFLPFHELHSLFLGHNQIVGFVEDEGLTKLSRLSNLEFLDLSFNNFNNSILSSLTALSSLNTLRLIRNKFQGTQGFEKLSKLSNLEYLDLSGNNFNNSIFSSLSALSSLNTLFLEANALKETLHTQELNNFLNLKKLSLSGNKIEGFESIKGGETQLRLSNLEVLDLSSNLFDNSILSSLNGLTSLKSLDLSYSKLKGSLHIKDLPNFKKLEFLDLSYTILDNSFLTTVGEMSALKVLRLANSGLHGTLSAQGLCELRCLQALDLWYNNLVGNLPACLANLTSLQGLHLSDNQFTGNVTESPITRLTSIQSLSLSDNHFQIPISFGPFYNHSKLKFFEGDNTLIYADTMPQSWTPKFQLNTISLSGCYGNVGEFPKFLYYQHDLRSLSLSHIHFKAEFPNWLLDNNTGLVSLHLANNTLSGLFNLPIRAHTYLQVLEIYRNFFYSEIPVAFAEYLPNLSYLDMSSNNFTGSIPSSFGDMSSLQSLNLSNNQLFGKIPDHLSNSPVLFLDISNNNLSGLIPKWMGNMSNLVEIRIPNNHLEGPIPIEFCQLDLDAIDLSENNISGSIPSCFSPPQIDEVRLSKNRLQGTLSDAFCNSSSLAVLDLSYNHLTGHIPIWIHRLPRLHFLLLNNNHLEGGVPTQLCQLDQLSLINLSHNNLSDVIPNCLRITTTAEVYRHPRSHPKRVAIDPNITQPIQFPTKWMSYVYQGRILSLMSGIDLSCNKFIGQIPREIGNLSNIHVLNLSHNSLSGPIPLIFADLKQIESLDLSNNFLSGKIPPELVGLYSLAVFSVANNNLSGAIPTTAQFATFEESSYEGNPLLCGKPLQKSCSASRSGSVMPRALVDHREDGGFMAMETFYVSFTVTYIIEILVLVIVLFINPYWRRWWFYHIETWMTSCYYFVVDNLT